MTSQPSEICETLTKNITHPDIQDSLKRAEFNYCLAIIIIHLVGIILLYHLKQKFLYLQERSMLAQFIMFIGSIVCFLIVPYRDAYVGRSNYSCLEVAILNEVAVLLITAPLFANYMIFLYKLRLQREDVRQRNMKDLRRKSEAYVRGFSSSNDESRNDSNSVRFGNSSNSFCSQVYEFIAIWRMEVDRTGVAQSDEQSVVQNVNPINDAKLHPVGESKDDTQQLNNNNNNSRNLRQKRRRSNKYFNNSTMFNVILPLCFSLINAFPFLLIIVIRIAADPLYANGCVGCPLNYVDIAATLGAGTFNGIFTAFVLYITRNEPDVVGTKKEFIMCLLLGSPFAMISWILIIADPGSLEKNGLMVWQIIEPSSVLACIIISIYLQIFIAFYQRWSILNDKSVSLDLNKMLDDEPCRRVLLRHCANELSSENVLFLLEAREWKELSLSGSSRTVLLRELIKINNSFLLGTSTTPINVSALSIDRIQSQIEEYRSDPLLNIDPNILDAVMKECCDIVLFDTLPRFRKTKLFKLEIIETGIIDRILTTPSTLKPAIVIPSSSSSA